MSQAQDKVSKDEVITLAVGSYLQVLVDSQVCKVKEDKGKTHFLREINSPKVEEEETTSNEDKSRRRL